jgi:[pyruvate, water dikinase]-phosphate phosphotransferase / [pyruvate, water dikinase] kinase
VNRTFRLHLVSGSTGETTHNLARACSVQFENLEVNTLEHYQIQNKTRMACVFADIEECHGAVIYKRLNNKLSAVLEQVGSCLFVLSINVLEAIIPNLKFFFGRKIRRQPGRQHQTGIGYFNRIKAMQFSPNLDDGQNSQALKRGKIILVGVSRTSKTPPSIYLAKQRGIKAENIPFVSGVTLPTELFLKNVGLVVSPTTSPERLVKFCIKGCWG